MNEDVRIPVYELRLQYFKWLPILHCILSVTCALACFCVALHNKDVTIYIPLLSETGDTSTQRVIFIIGGVFISDLTALIILIKYLILRYYLCLDKKIWKVQNTINCLIGLFSMSCLVIIVGFPATSEMTAHTAVAALYFVTILVYTCADCFITYHIVSVNSQASPGMQKAQKYKFLLCTLELLFCILYLILYHLAQYYWKNHHWKKPALKEPGDNGFWLMMIACFTEWVVLCSLVLYILLFSVDFASFHVVMLGIPASVNLNTFPHPAQDSNPERNMDDDEGVTPDSNTKNEPKFTEQSV